MRLYNTLTRQEEEFVPLRAGTVRMYACGLTVYARGHIGNFRYFVAIDVLRRVLKYVAGFPVRQVTNFTDVDDRTIVESKAAGVSLRDHTDRFIAAFREDAATLGLEPGSSQPRARGRRTQALRGDTLQARGYAALRGSQGSRRRLRALGTRGVGLREDVACESRW